jgi:hypothetical protein
MGSHCNPQPFAIHAQPNYLGTKSNPGPRRRRAAAMWWYSRSLRPSSQVPAAATHVTGLKMHF